MYVHMRVKQPEAKRRERNGWGETVEAKRTRTTFQALLYKLNIKLINYHFVDSTECSGNICRFRFLSKMKNRAVIMNLSVNLPMNTLNL